MCQTPKRTEFKTGNVKALGELRWHNVLSSHVKSEFVVGSKVREWVSNLPFSLFAETTFFKPRLVIGLMALKGAFVANNTRETPVVCGCSSDDQTPHYYLVRYKQLMSQAQNSTWFRQTHCNYAVIAELWYITVMYYTCWFLQHGLLFPETGTSGTIDVWLSMRGKNSSMFILCQFWQVYPCWYFLFAEFKNFRNHI